MSAELYLGAEVAVESFLGFGADFVGHPQLETVEDSVEIVEQLLYLIAVDSFEDSVHSFAVAVVEHYSEFVGFVQPAELVAVVVASVLQVVPWLREVDLVWE